MLRISAHEIHSNSTMVTASNHQTTMANIITAKNDAENVNNMSEYQLKNPFFFVFVLYHLLFKHERWFHQFNT